MANWWRRDELLALLQAWEQALPAPRDRDELQDAELARLHARFEALRPSGGDGSALQPEQVEAQRQRMVKSFLFIRAFNAESARAGRPTWFQLSKQQQDELRRINDRHGGMAPVDEGVFETLRRVCEAPMAPPSQPSQREEEAEGQPRMEEEGEGKEEEEKVGGQEEEEEEEVDRPAVDEMKAAAEALAGLPMFRPQASNRMPSPSPSPSLSPSVSPPSSPIRMPVASNPMRLNERAKREYESPSDSLSESESESELELKLKPKPSTIRKTESEMGTPPKGKGRRLKGPPKWTKRDEERLVSAWHEVVTDLANSDNHGGLASRAEALKFNALVHDRYLELCNGRSTRTNQSTGAKKHAVLTAFRFLRGFLRTLASQSDRPNWFGMTVEERIELQKMHGHHQEYACTIEKDMYERLAEIDDAMKAVLAPGAGRNRPTSASPRPARQLRSGSIAKSGGDDTQKKPVAKKSPPVGRGKQSGGLPGGFLAPQSSSEEVEEEGSEDEGDATEGDAPSPKYNRLSTANIFMAELRSPIPPKRPHSASKEAVQRNSRDADHVEADPSEGEVSKRRRTMLADAGWVTRLLDAQTQRFEALLAEFREERRQERQHNVEIILEALKMRGANAQKADHPSPFVEALVEKQRQHMLSIFQQLQAEHGQEREQARVLLRELSSARPAASHDEQKE